MEDSLGRSHPEYSKADEKDPGLTELTSATAVRDLLCSSPDGRFNLVVGSIISAGYPSCFPDVPTIKKLLMDELVDNLRDTPTLFHKTKNAFENNPARNRLERMPFEALWQQVARAYNSQAVISILKCLSSRGDPNANHRAIAWLIQNGYVSCILTTNYDEHIERSIGTNRIHYELDKENPTIVRVHLGDSKPDALTTFIKLHGTVSEPRTLAFMFPQVIIGFTESVTSDIAALLGARPTLFCGYGCNDWDLRSLWERPLESVWVSHKNIREIDRSQRWIGVALRHRPQGGGRVFVSDLKCPTTATKTNILQELVTSLNGPSISWATGADSACSLTRDCSETKSVAALARLVDALVLELAAELYLVAANKASDDRIKSDLAVAGSVAQSHGGNLRRAIVTCENVLRMPRLSTGHRLILEAWLCFLYEMIGSRIAMCKHGWRCVWLLCWHQQECRRALAKGWAKRSLEELSLIEGYTLGMQVIAYSLNRFGFKHPCLDSAIGRLARRVHDHSARYTEATGSLKDYADRQRELAHANMLAHDSTAALECANAAIEAYQWVGDSQNESNAHRTKGWVYLQWGRAKRTDSLAQRSFKDALSRKGVWFYSTRDGPRQD